MKNEKGSTLLLVLVIIVVITTLGMVLGSMTLSTRMQFNKTDRLNVATDLAEMGITYLDKKIDHITAIANQIAKVETKKYMDRTTGETVEEVLNEYSRLFCLELNNTELNLSKETYKKIYEIETGKTFEITKLFDKIDTTDCQNKDEIPLKFISKGTDGTDSKSIEVVAYLTKNKGSGGGGAPGGNTPGDPSPTEGDFDDNIITEDITSDDFDKKESLIIDESTYFKGAIEIQQGKHTLIIKGDAYFANEVDIYGNSTLIIYGDAFFTSRINDEKNDNATSYNFCIQGNTFLVVDGILQTYHIDSKHLNPNSCPTFPADEPDELDESDIDMDWTSEDKEIDVTY